MTQLPLFPLNTVIFPGGLLPLRIFEPRYLDMVSACLRTDTGFGVCLLKSGWATDRSARIHPVGTLCKIVDWTKLPDGLLGVTAQGTQRIRVVSSQVRSDHLMIGEVEPLPAEAELPLPMEFIELSALLRQIIDEIGPPYSDTPARYDQCAWVAGRLSELLPLQMAVKQRLLEADDVRGRLALLRTELAGLHYL
ncbi:MAG: LON peptidase substrate-binding domain-containing protein [Gammaproteobacteria bacterium]|nr:LON peptidase substrate-binding domain-containing protein [Gammaproteobacteria bacterium]